MNENFREVIIECGKCKQAMSSQKPQTSNFVSEFKCTHCGQNHIVKVTSLGYL